MSKKSLTDKTPAELKREADKLRVKLNKLKTDRFLGEVKNIREIRTTRRELARTLTVVNQTKAKE